MLSGEDPKSVLAKETSLGQALAAHGPRGYWETLLELAATPPNPPEAYFGVGGIATIYCKLGQFDKALDLLEEAHGQHLTRVELGVDPAYDPLRSNPRFTRLLREIHLVH